MARNQCRNCGKAIKPLDGQWQHVWMVKTENGDRIYAGSRTCAWVGRPGPVGEAEPFAMAEEPIRWEPVESPPLPTVGYGQEAS
jgi:hypothetical protein